MGGCITVVATQGVITYMSLVQTFANRIKMESLIKRTR